MGFAHGQSNVKELTKGGAILIPTATEEQLTAFYHNPTIQRLAKIDQWTVSDNEKKPLAINIALQTNFQHTKLYSYKNNGLMALNDFDQRVPKILTNRALRLNMEKCHVLALDIEPKYSHKRWDGYLGWLPIDYIEYSTHNGYHVLINIPDELFQDPELHKIITETTFWTIWDQGVSHQGIEFVFNEHFMTLTRRVITNPKDYPFEQFDVPYKTRIKALGNFIKLLNKDHQQGEKVEVTANALNGINQKDRDNAKIIQSYITKDEIEHAKLTATKNAKHKNDGQVDTSNVEWRFLSSIYGYYKHIPDNTAYLVSLQQQLNMQSIDEVIKYLVKPQTTALVMTLVGQNNLTPRKKWQTKRRGVPWLLSNSFKILEWFKNNTKNN